VSIIVDEKGEKFYKSMGNMTYEDKEKADKLDSFLKAEVCQIEDRLRKQGLLELKGQSGSVKLWYNVGVELRNLWQRTKVEYALPDTLITLFFKAVYDNSDKLKPAASRAERLRNSLFYYCYLLADFPWDVVDASGSWAEWSDFFDSKRIRSDPRIIQWFAERKIIELRVEKGLTRHDWFKLVNRMIRNELKHIDTTVLDRAELYQQLDKILGMANR
jgi:hypothetical protein